jgi:hypothetical protein
MLGESAMAILGLKMGPAILSDTSCISRAQLAADYLISHHKAAFTTKHEK